VRAAHLRGDYDHQKKTIKASEFPTVLYQWRKQMSANRGVVYVGPGKVEVRNILDPVMASPDGRKIDHAVILKVISTNICGSDQHMVRGRTTAEPGLVLGHEITGQVIEKGSDVEQLEIGDIVSVPFNVACGRCRCCKSQDTGVCLTVNPSRAGGAYGYVDMGGWIGGQAHYVMVPYADFNLLKFPDRDQAMDKIRDLTMLSDILPTGFHGAVQAGVGVGSIVYVAGAGPVGLAAAASAQILGAAVVMVGDFNKERLAHAAKMGFEPVDLSQSDRLGEMIAEITGSPEVDSAIDAVGFEARGHSGGEQPAIVLNQMMEITRAAGSIGIPGLYVTEDPGAVDEAAKQGSLSLRFGLGWAKAQSFHTGQTPVIKYNRQLMQAILHGRLNIADIVNAQVISLEDAAQGYESFDQGAAKKFVLDPHGMLAKAS
jgi:glutathione-independent formaldehyde dehydrogenase